MVLQGLPGQAVTGGSNPRLELHVYLQVYCTVACRWQPSGGIHICSLACVEFGELPVLAQGMHSTGVLALF